MKTITSNTEAEVVEKRSKFIGNLFYVESVEQAEEKIKEIKKKYNDARHSCFAYRIRVQDSVVEKFSDDGEPSKTAGAPILNVLVQQHLNHILCVVIRYFGGIKLGAGGLVRAYSNSCSEALKKAQFGNVIAAKKVRIIINYEMIDKLNYILQDFKITYKEFSDKVSYEVLVPDDKLNLLESFPYEIINDCFITQEKRITS